MRERRIKELAHAISSAVQTYGLTAVVEALASDAAQRAAFILERTPGHKEGHAWDRVAERLAALARYTRAYATFTK